MRISAATLALLVPLVLLPTASRLSASGDDPNPNPSPSPKEKRIVVDGDRVVVWDDGDLQGHRGGGYLGVRSVEMTPELRQHFGAPRDAGVLVGTVEPEGPAAKAGIQVGDILTAVDGEPLGSARALSHSIRRHKDGDTVKIDLLRDRSRKTLSATLKETELMDHEIHLGELGPGMHRFAWRDGDDLPALAPIPPVPPVPPVPPLPGSSRDGLRDRMESLEQRMKDLESRLPKQ